MIQTRSGSVKKEIAGPGTAATMRIVTVRTTTNPSRAERWRTRVALFTGLALAGSPMGCDRFRPGSTSQPAGQPASSISSNTSAAVGVDGEDDPRSPAYIPVSHKDGNWTKVEPVRVFAPAALARVFSEAEATRLGYFRIKSAARCTYSLRRGSQPAVKAALCVIETTSAEDAYGILTCRSSSPEIYRIGGETRVEHAGGLALHCWQGKCYVFLSAGEDDSETTEEMIRLLMNLCGKITREDLPPILHALPEENRRPGRLWLVRHPASIRPDAIELDYSLDVPGVAAILGLGKDTLMCIASYDVPDARRPNTVWVVNYPTIKAAHDAYARYSRLIGKSTDEIVRSASVVPAQGSFLAGTWTAEEESMQYMLPRVLKLLPQ